MIWRTKNEQPHVLETTLTAKNNSVYWWKDKIIPGKTGKYSINKG